MIRELLKLDTKEQVEIPIKQKPKQEEITITHIKTHVKNIEVKNVEQHDVKAMFNQMNQLMKSNKPCN